MRDKHGNTHFPYPKDPPSSFANNLSSEFQERSTDILDAASRNARFTCFDLIIELVILSYQRFLFIYVEVQMDCVIDDFVQQLKIL